MASTDVMNRLVGRKEFMAPEKDLKSVYRPSVRDCENQVVNVGLGLVVRHQVRS